MSKEPTSSPKPSVLAAVLHPLAGVLLVVVLYVGLFFVDFLLGADLRVMGVGDAATAQKVMDRYGRTLLAHQAKVLAFYAVLGACVGVLIQALVLLWERFSPVSSRRPATRWPLVRRFFFGTLCALFLHVFLLSRAIVLRPALFAEALYERGGFAARFMVFLTHGPGSVIVWMLGVGLFLFLLSAPLSSIAARAFFKEFWKQKRRTLPIAVSIVLLVGVFGVAIWPFPVLYRAQKEPARKPSVLLIAVDSLRADRLFAPRRVVAPAMMQLARESVRFEQAFVSVPRTFPSFVTLLSGRAPYHHGIRTMFPTQKERAAVPPALPKLLGAQGYHTAVFSDFCGEIFSRIDLGFQHIAVPAFDAKELLLQRGVLVHRNALPYVSGAGLGQVGLALGQAVFPELEGVSELADPKLLAARALHDIAAHRGQPFFLTVFFSTAHFPYAAPAPHYRRFLDPKYRGPFLYYKPPLKEVAGSEDIAAVQALYDGSVAAADEGVRVLLDGLAALGRDQDTIVVLLSDHGENLYDEPSRGMGHGDHLEGDHAMQVPWLVRDPTHRFSPKSVHGLVRDLDLVPTLLSLLSVPFEAESFDGVSVVPLLSGEKETLGLSALSETELWFTASGPGFSMEQRLPYPDVTTTTDISPSNEISVSPQYQDLVTVAKHRSLRTERYKIIYRPTRQGPRYSVFDVKTDPEQRNDLSTSSEALLMQMKNELFRALRHDSTVEITGDFILPKESAPPPAPN